MNKEEIKKMFRRIEIDKSNDSCGFEFADGFDCTFDNIATCYDDRLKLYDLVKELQQENQQLHNKIDKAIDFIDIYTNGINLEAFDCLKLMYKIKDLLKDSNVDE